MPEEEGQSNSGETNTPQGGGEGETKTSPATKSFSQEELNQIIARRVAEAEKAALGKLQEKTGMTPEELEALATETKQRQEAEKSELDKLREANESLKKDKDAGIDEARGELHIERVKAQLLKAKVPLPEEEDKADAALDRLVQLVNAKVGSTAEEIRNSITDLKGEFPQLFSASEASQGGTPDSRPSGKPTRKPALGSTAAERVAAIAQENNKARGVQVPTA